LFQFVEKHGKILYDLISQEAVDRKVFFISGSIDGEKREEIRKIIETEQNAIVVASYGTSSTGINIRNLHNVIFASPSKSRVRNLQSIGRGLRTSDNKTSATLYDIADDLGWKQKKNHTILHFVERIKIYNEEKFPYRTYTVDLV
jgi:superfamily II DNA or RNA helicase